MELEQKKIELKQKEQENIQNHSILEQFLHHSFSITKKNETNVVTTHTKTEQITEQKTEQIITTANESVLISFPTFLQSYEITETMQKIPDDIVNQIITKICAGKTPPKRTYEQVLRFYTKKSTNAFTLSIVDSTVSILNKIVELLKHLIEDFDCFTDNFHLQTAYLAYNWSAMIIELKKVHGNQWSAIIISKMAIAILVAIIQGIHKEFKVSKAVSIAYSSYATLGDMIETAPADIKKAIPTFLQTDTYPTWHKELGRKAKIDDLTMAAAINMLYTFRIGDVFIMQLISNKKIDNSIITSITKSLSPIPVQNEQEKLLRLFPDGKLY